MKCSLALMSQTDVTVAASLILLAFLGVFALFFVTAWVNRNSVGKSPYTGMPLRRGSELPYESARKILQFLFEKQEYDNRIFEIYKAAVCRETGRVFPHCVSFFDTVKVDWTFLQKRFPGHYVSWGSLTDQQQAFIRSSHESMEGFQTAFSSPRPSPRDVTAQYVYLKPGPLYVDINSKVLLGWQCVPDSDFEVLIVQRPKQPINFGTPT